MFVLACNFIGVQYILAYLEMERYILAYFGVRDRRDRRIFYVRRGSIFSTRLKRFRSIEKVSDFLGFFGYKRGLVTRGGRPPGHDQEGGRLLPTFHSLFNSLMMKKIKA